MSKPVSELPAFEQKLSLATDAALQRTGSRHATRAAFAERQGLWDKLRSELAKVDAVDRETARRAESRVVR